MKGCLGKYVGNLGEGRRDWHQRALQLVLRVDNEPVSSVQACTRGHYEARSLPPLHIDCKQLHGRRDLPGHQSSPDHDTLIPLPPLSIVCENWLCGDHKPLSVGAPPSPKLSQGRYDPEQTAFKFHCCSYIPRGPLRQVSTAFLKLTSPPTLPERHFIVSNGSKLNNLDPFQIGTVTGVCPSLPPFCLSWKCYSTEGLPACRSPLLTSKTHSFSLLKLFL